MNAKEIISGLTTGRIAELVTCSSDSYICNEFGLKTHREAGRFRILLEKKMKRDFRVWMKNNVKEFVDDVGEVDYTIFAENVCQKFGCDDIGGPLDDSDHWVWDMAIDVGNSYKG